MDAKLSRAQVPLAFKIGFWGCILIAIAVVIRRVMILAYPSPSTAAESLDAAFAGHAALTLAHIVPAFAFVVLTPVVPLRTSARTRWPEYLLFLLGAIVGFTAYAMSVYSVGGWTERSAVLVFDSLFLFSLFRSYFFMRRNNVLQKRRWIMRAIVVLLGIATTRPVMGVFFATRAMTHLTPNQFFGIAFWIGFSINTLVVELWLRSRNSEVLNYS